MVNDILKKILIILVRVLELPFAIVNLALVIIISLIFFLQIRTVERAKRMAKKADRALEKLEGKVEWKKKNRI